MRVLFQQKETIDTFFLVSSGEKKNLFTKYFKLELSNIKNNSGHELVNFITELQD